MCLHCVDLNDVKQYARQTFRTHSCLGHMGEWRAESKSVTVWPVSLFHLVWLALLFEYDAVSTR